MDTEKLRALPQPLVEFIAGFTAGISTTVVAHPLDLIKTRLQVDNARSTRLGSSARVAQAVLRHEGGWTALYRGLTPNLIGNSTSWALYFLWYGELKKSISSLHGRRETLTPYDYFFASGIAGILTAICTNPVWVIKTRMLATASIRTGAYASMSDGIRHIWKSDGVLGFYRGLVPSLFGVSHGALQFTAYEELKTLARKRSTSKGKKLTSWEVFWCGALSKAFAGSVTYPYQVVRSRLQLYDADRRYRNLRDVIFQVWRFEGFAGFYKGLGPNLLRVVPSSCITLLMAVSEVYFSSLARFLYVRTVIITACHIACVIENMRRLLGQE